jgi:hypothetical protein
MQSSTTGLAGPGPPPRQTVARPPLLSSYYIRRNTKAFFIVGKVLLCLWAEPAGPYRTTGDVDGYLDGRYSDEYVFSKIRWFVVVRVDDTYCTVLQIATYGSQGVSKPMLKKSEHGIIYSDDRYSLAREYERAIPGETPMQQIPIRVNPDTPNQHLDPMSRVHYGKPYTIEYNLKVRSFGVVDPRSLGALLHQYREVQFPALGTVPRLPKRQITPNEYEQERLRNCRSREDESLQRRDHMYSTELPIGPGYQSTAGVQGRRRRSSFQPAARSSVMLVTPGSGGYRQPRQVHAARSPPHQVLQPGIPRTTWESNTDPSAQSHPPAIPASHRRYNVSHAVAL